MFTVTSFCFFNCTYVSTYVSCLYHKSRVYPESNSLCVYTYLANYSDSV